MHAQSLSYPETNSFNISSPTHLGAVNIPSLERTPTGVSFGNSGNKFYIVGTELYIVKIEKDRGIITKKLFLINLLIPIFPS